MATKYKPIVKAKAGPFSGTALVGTHSVIIGWTLNDLKKRKGLLGFAIRRRDKYPDGETYRMNWLGGYKRFEETDDGKSNVYSNTAPFQRFRWNDYTLKPGHHYKYEIFPMYGTPTDLKRSDDSLVFRIKPSLEDQDELGVYVNRGVTSAMAYLRRFDNQHPHDVGEPAYKWLSRGLKESLLDYIANAKKGQALHVAIYEFFDHGIAQAFKDVKKKGVDVRIVYSAVAGKKSTHESNEVIDEFGLRKNAIPRTTVSISHNKVVIRLSKRGTPLDVWTGSANFSENAFNFQTNTGMIVKDNTVARHFEDYFQGLVNNPPKAESKKINRIIMDKADAMPDRFAEKTFFSPIKSVDILDTAADLVRNAKSAVFVSAPFGLDKKIIDAVNENSNDIIEYGLVNTTAKNKIKELRIKNTRFFPPNKLYSHMGKAWDAKAFGKHKIHAKTIIVDPWSSNPKVLIGSANFSKNSCKDNDENAMLITGNKRLVAILTTEFMRMYDHYKSRWYIRQTEDKNKAIKKKNKERKKKGLKELPLKVIPKHLVNDNSWSDTAFDPDVNSHKFRDRIVFSGGE